VLASPSRSLRCLLVLPALLVAVPAQAAKPGAGQFSKYDAAVDPILAQMTLAEKVGQMTQGDLASIPDPAAIGKLFLGSVLAGGNSDPKAGNSLEAWRDTYNTCQKEATATRLGIPLVFGVDAVHGHNNVLGAVVFPHNIGLGCANNPELVEEISAITALEVRATGPNWAFAPCVTVPQDDRWGRVYEGYAEVPERVATLGQAAVRGLQGSDMSEPTRVLACAKHFIGDGGTTAEVRKPQGGSIDQLERLRLDQGDTRVDEETLRRVHLPGYPPCLEAGVGSIMPSYSSWNGVKCSGSKELMTDLLKDELGFEGFLISDWNAIDQVDPDFKTAIKKSVNAGMDMGMVPERYELFTKLLTELVEEGSVPMARIDDAVRRILRVKAAMGLLDKSRDHLADPKLAESFGSPEHREVARRAVRESIVLLKNDGVLPIGGAKRVHVSGAAANDLGVQCGGWTVDWQGKPGETTPGGTTIVTALRTGWSDDVVLTNDDDGRGARDADVAIVVVGEKPYAEGGGDEPNPALSKEDHEVIDRVAASGTPTVLVVLSGRPVVLGDAVDKVDAVVAAWLPGTEGQGVADVLLGAHKPTATLSFSWPRSNDQQPINQGDEDYDPLFPVGHGLTY
jgi:beta-glucosidase